jgi:hypothetical protein
METKEVDKYLEQSSDLEPRLGEQAWEFLQRKGSWVAGQIVKMAADESLPPRTRLYALKILSDKVLPDRAALELRHQVEPPMTREAAAEEARLILDHVDELKAINLNPQNQVIYTTRQAIRALQTTNTTFYRKIRRLGIKPLKKRGSNARWYSYQTLMTILPEIYRPLDILDIVIGRQGRLKE